MATRTAPPRRSRNPRRPTRNTVSAPLPVIVHLPVTDVAGGGETKPNRRAQLAVALPLLVLVIGVTLIGIGAAAVGIVLIALGALTMGANRIGGSHDRLVRSIGGRVTGRAEDPGLFNLIEGLCVANGIQVPEVRILDDPCLNAIVLGRDPRHAVLILTAGLVEALDRMELEAVLAHELAHVRRGDLKVAATATAALGLVAQFAPCGRTACRFAGSGREPIADAIGVRMTRYPPGLISALKKIDRSFSVRPAGLSSPTARLTAGLWCAPLGESIPAEAVVGQLDLDLRIAALREL